MMIIQPVCHCQYLQYYNCFSVAQTGRGDAELIIMPQGESHTKPLYSSIVFQCSVNGLSQDIDPILKWFGKEGIEITSTTGRFVHDNEH